MVGSASSMTWSTVAYVKNCEAAVSTPSKSPASSAASSDFCEALTDSATACLGWTRTGSPDCS
jgi:hypothetical protein